MTFYITNLVFEGEGVLWDHIGELDFSEDIPISFGLNCYRDENYPNKFFQKPGAVLRFMSKSDIFSEEELLNFLKFIIKATIGDEYPYLSLKKLGIEEIEIKIISYDYYKDT